MFSNPDFWKILEIAVQVLILIVIIYYACQTQRMAKANQITANANRLVQEYSSRPVLAAELIDGSHKVEPWFRIENKSNTDAIGLVILEAVINGTEEKLFHPAYMGKKVWYFPARSSIIGHQEISGQLKQRSALVDPKGTFEIRLYLYCKAYSRDRAELGSSKRYFNLPLRWVWKETDGPWVPELTSDRPLHSPRPDWGVIEGKM